MTRIAVLVSGGGSNLQALLDAPSLGGGEIYAVISSNPNAYALTRAKEVPVRSVLRPGDYASREEYTHAIVCELKKHEIELVVLAGFMFVLTDELCREYENRVINVHPSLIPAFCGDGFYGLHVHEKALEYGVKVSGATVHFVSAVTDGGPIILQKSVEVSQSDTPESLQKKIMRECEWKLLPRAVELFCSGKLVTEGRKVIIKGD